ncbi:MAG: histidine--tRNA ligase [Chloroflexota bacterium]|nr:MAG: histidine--tRNA ligase [Chloroflexota bacterium]
MKNIIQPVKGTRDFYPKEKAVLSWLYANMREVSEAFGYQEYDGPFLEPIDLYAAKSGEELVKEQAFVFPDRSKKLITLRPELTPTLTRMVAQRQQQLHYPLRWWSFGPFWRYESPQKGRAREFFQWNIDLLGVDSPEADAELAAVMASFFKKVGLAPSQVQVMINNRRLVDEQLGKLEIPLEKRGQVFRLIDKREKMKEANWEAYAEDKGLTPNQLDGLKAMLTNHSLWEESEELVRFFEAVDALGIREYLQYAPHIIRGLDYYTGTVFEAQAVTADIQRAVLGGGRYDNLLADVGGDPLPGVGFAMGDMVIAIILEELGLLPKDRDAAPAKVMVTVFNEATLLPAYSLAAELRQAGLKVFCYPEAQKLGKQFKHAGRIGSRVAVILGPDELDNNIVAVKDLETRKQAFVPRQEVAIYIKNLLDDASAS